MWVNLTPDEIATILSLIDSGPLVEKLTAPKDADADAFNDAADDIHDGLWQVGAPVIRRCKGGAEVMRWVYVPNSRAGIATDYSGFELKPETEERLKSLAGFCLDDWGFGELGTDATGEIDGCEWRLSVRSSYWWFNVNAQLVTNSDDDGRWEHSEPRDAAADDHGIVSFEEMFRLISEGIDRFREYVLIPRRSETRPVFT